MRKRLPLALVLLALAAPLAARRRAPLPTPSPTPSASWPMFKGDPQRSGRGPALQLPVQVAWRIKVKGSLYSSPAIADGKVVLGSSNRHVFAFDLADGRAVWSAELPDRVWGSSPAVDLGRVYIGCVDGCVYSLALHDGAAVGNYCAQKKSTLGDGPDVLASPLVAGGRLIFGSDNNDIYGWDLAGKRDLWRFITDDILHDNSGALCGGLLLYPSRDGKLYALGAEDGALRWSFTAPKAFNTTPACDGARVYLGNVDGRMRALDLASGELRWEFKTGPSRGIMSSPALDGKGSLVFGSSDDHIYCLDAASGALRWKVETDGVVLASPLITGGLVWVGSYDDQFRALNLADGAEVYRLELDGGVFTSAAVAGDRIVVAGRSGDLVCLQATAVEASSKVKKRSKI